MSGIIVKPRSRIFHGHDWVYSSEVKKIFGNPSPGDVISLKDFKDRRLGSAIFNPNSQIVARRFSWRRQDLHEEFFESRLERAENWRKAHADKIDLQFCRLVWSESDGLPGVIIDRYGDHFVLQTLTLAMDKRKQLIVDTLVKRYAPKCIVERNDSPARKAEGMELISGVLHGETPEIQHVSIGGLPFQIDLIEGQKTGLYLDQCSNYGEVAKLANGRKVLDLFCNQGGFALACAKAGAATTIGIDSSEKAITTASENAAREALPIEFRALNVFDYLKEADTKENPDNVDFIILDPPSFAKNKHAMKDALRGYKEIHLRALKLLKPGGILATFSCSHHMGPNVFHEMISSASVDAKKTIRQIAIYSQRPDHPIVTTLPETEYLRGYAFQVMPSW